MPLLGAGANLCGRPAELEWRAHEYLPSGAELAGYLADEFDYPRDEVLDLVRVSEYAFVLNGSGPLYDSLHTLFDADYPISPLHRFLARLPGAVAEAGRETRGGLLVTTNYDDALERALAAEGRAFEVVSYIADGDDRGRFVHFPSEGEPRVIERPNEYRGLDPEEQLVVVKIHGAIDRSDPEARWDSYVITEDHYIEYLANTDIANLVPVTLAAKLRRSHFLFLGYSMRDWNLRVILHRLWGAQKLRYKSWAVQLRPGVIDREFWELRGVDILDAPLEDYVARLDEQVPRGARDATVVTAAARLDDAPYAGLRHYTEAEAAFFFGREGESRLVIANLLAARLTLLYGESGVGKSSLLHAGVAPRLRRLAQEEADEESERRLAVVVYSDWTDADPVAALVARVSAEVDRLVPGAGARVANADLSESLRHLGDGLGGEILVVLDQFEESFLYHQDDDRPGTLAFELSRALRVEDVPANFLVSIREDQLSRLDRFKGRIPNLFDNLLRVDHLDRQSARDAILRPLERLNADGADGAAPFSAEPELVERVLDELQEGRVTVGRRGAGTLAGATANGDRIETPYLQLVLARLWAVERADGSRVLRAATLDRLGGAEEIVRQHLDDALASLSSAEQDAAAQLFHYLVTPSGTKIAHHYADLAEYAGVAEDEAAALLDRLAGEARILRPVGDERFEIYHDVLAPAVLDWSARRQEEQLEELRQARRGRRRWRFLALSLVLAALALVPYGVGFLRTVELASVDARFDLRGTVAAPDVVVVDIDKATFTELEEEDEMWPFRRSLHAQVIDRLRLAGVQAIAYDLQFTEQTDAEEDNALIEAVERARGRIALATIDVDEQGQTAIFGGDEFLREIGARAGHSALPADADAVVRRVPHATDGLKSLAIVAAELARGTDIAASDLGGETAWIDFAGPPGAVATVSFVDVLRGRVPESELQGKVAVVGGGAPLQDVHATSTSGNEFMTGPEIHANATQTTLDGFPLQDVAWVLSALLIVALAVLPALLSLRLAPVWVFVAGIGAAVVYAVVAQLSLGQGRILPVVYPLGLLMLASVAALLLDARLGSAAQVAGPARPRLRPRGRTA